MASLEVLGVNPQKPDVQFYEVFRAETDEDITDQLKRWEREYGITNYTIFGSSPATPPPPLNPPYGTTKKLRDLPTGTIVTQDDKSGRYETRAYIWFGTFLRDVSEDAHHEDYPADEKMLESEVYFGHNELWVFK